MFTASSTVDGSEPFNAPLDNPTGWRARDSDSSPWVQVNLGEPVTVSGIITLGVKVRKCETSLSSQT